MDIPRQHRGAPASRGGQFAHRARTDADTELGTVTSLDDFRNHRTLNAALNSFITSYGAPLSDSARARLIALTEQVTVERWEDGYSIMLTPDTTLWQALLRHTNYSVTSAGSPSDYNGHTPFTPGGVSHRWPELPTADEIRYAILATQARDGA